MQIFFPTLQIPLTLTPHTHPRTNSLKRHQIKEMDLNERREAQKKTRIKESCVPDKSISCHMGVGNSQTLLFAFSHFR